MAHSVTLNWNAPTTGDPVTSYDVKRASAAAGPFASIGTATSTTFTDNNVVAGQTYWYEVDSVNASGESGPSNVVTATIPLAVPNPPTGLAVSSVV